MWCQTQVEQRVLLLHATSFTQIFTDRPPNVHWVGFCFEKKYTGGLGTGGASTSVGVPTPSGGLSPYYRFVLSAGDQMARDLNTALILWPRPKALWAITHCVASSLKWGTTTNRWGLWGNGTVETFACIHRMQYMIVIGCTCSIHFQFKRVPFLGIDSRKCIWDVRQPINR